MTLKEYLTKTHSPKTVSNYLFEIGHYLNYFGEQKARKARYKDVLKYVELLREQYQNPATIHRIIIAIKHYYYYLNEIGERTDHPCRYLSINDREKSQIQLQDLLKESELKQLLQRKERYGILKTKNQVIMSLLVNQALRVKEICKLTINDIDLEKATIQIHPTTKTNGRTLNLKPEQIMLFYNYIHEVRRQIIKEQTDVLVITKKGTAEKGEGIHYLVSTFRKLIPNKRLTPTTIRQSVIANLLAKGTDLRIVQVFAGHLKPSSTEKYRQSNLEALKEAVNKYHPLG